MARRSVRVRAVPPASPLALACPSCDAKPGQDCLTTSGGFAAVHLARIAAAARSHKRRTAAANKKVKRAARCPSLLRTRQRGAHGGSDSPNAWRDSSTSTRPIRCANGKTASRVSGRNDSAEARESCCVRVIPSGAARSRSSAAKRELCVPAWSAGRRRAAQSRDLSFFRGLRAAPRASWQSEESQKRRPREPHSGRGQRAGCPSCLRVNQR